MTPTTSSTRTTVRARTARLAVAGIIALSATLSACSAGDSGADMQSDSGTGSSAVGADEGGVPAPDAAAEERSDVPAATNPDANRQVVQTGDVAMSVTDPQTAADEIVRLTEQADGRVDDRAENAATDTEVGTATLTIRLPASAVTPVLVALRGLGDVESVDLTRKDVTGAAQDLDARIHAMELSVDRMTNLLATATSHDDIVVAENALTERETTLEALRSQRAALAEQVSLSTLRVALVGPDLPPYVEPVPPPTPPTGPQSFLEGLSTGWGALVELVAGIAIVVGILLPWLAFGGALAALVVAAARWTRRWRVPATTRPRAAGPVNPFDVPAGPPVAPQVDPDQQAPR